MGLNAEFVPFSAATRMSGVNIGDSAIRKGSADAIAQFIGEKGGRLAGDVASLQADNPGTQVPIDLVTTSGSGLDPDITPEAAAFQISRVAKVRGIPVEKLKELVQRNTISRQFGLLGEPRVNVLELNLDVDDASKHASGPSEAAVMNR